MQGALVQVVDLALDHLGELVVTDDDLVDEAREEVAGVESAEARLALEGVCEALQRSHSSDMDRQDDVPLRDQIDLPPLQTRRLLVRGLESLEGQVEPILRPGQLGAGPFRCESRSFAPGKVEQVCHGTKGPVVAPVDVDPEELVLAELRDVDVGEVDRLVVAVRVEQPGGDGAQGTRASSAAAITAITAVRYWRSSIARSDVGSVSSIANGWWVLSVSIDLWILES
jgi:hypothetical protein